MASSAITVQQGETLLVSFAYQNADQSAVNLTGHTLTLTVASSEGATLGTVTAAGLASGLVDLRLADELTATWPLGRHTYRVTDDTPAGDRFWLLKGALVVEGPEQ